MGRKNNQKHSRPYPTIVAVYGGPHVQRVRDEWPSTADLRSQRFASMGFLVVKCDNRGSSRRGVAFESAIKNRLGNVEVEDQVLVVQNLQRMGISDATRVGLVGWRFVDVFSRGGGGGESLGN